MVTIRVTTPSRLHFGMFSFGRAETRQFGGVGAMISAPGIRLTVRPAQRPGSRSLAERAMLTSDLSLRVDV